MLDTKGDARTIPTTIMSEYIMVMRIERIIVHTFGVMYG